jgi:hypothetical protein
MQLLRSEFMSAAARQPMRCAQRAAVFHANFAGFVPVRHQVLQHRRALPKSP